MKVEDQLIFLNQKAGMNFAEIADAVGCSERTLNNIKKTGNGRVKTLNRIGEMYQRYFSKDPEISTQTDGNFGIGAEKLLGKVLAKRAWLASVDEGFDSVDEFIRFAVRKEADAADLKREKNSSIARNSQPSPDEPAGDVARELIRKKSDQ